MAGHCELPNFATIKNNQTDSIKAMKTKVKYLLSVMLMALLCFGSIDATAQRTIRRGERQQTQTQQTRQTQRRTQNNAEQQYKNDRKVGEKLFDEKKYAEAKKHFETMLPKYPKHEKDINRYIMMCDTFLAQQVEEEERIRQEEEVRREQEYRNSYSRGEVMIRNGEYEQALTYYRNMQSAYPNHTSEISAQITACEDAMRTTGYINGHEWVDLGLPSGLKWATCNVGATSPEQYGKYYTWGETSTKSSYTKDNSKTYRKSMGGISGSYSYDAARANWGGSWRMPTKTEFDELLNNCNWEWTSWEGHYGYKVTSKKNGKSIFLPAAGCRSGSSLYNDGSNGCYWSSTPDGSNYYRACSLSFNGGDSDTHWSYRYGGQSVRPVSD